MQARPRLAASDDADGTAAAAEPQKDGDAAAGGGVAFSVEGDEGEDDPKTPSRKSKASGGAGAGSYDELLSRMGSEGGGRQGTALVAEELKTDVDKLNRRMRNMNRCLVDPRSKFMQVWDFFTLFALFFTLIVTPYEVALKDTTFSNMNTVGGHLFVINWLVNLIFITDLVINFVLPYKESTKKGGGTVKNHKKIAIRYLSSWFPIDFISILPFDSIEVFASLAGQDSPFGESGGTLKIIKMIRLLRLLKLARILRASRIFSRWENELGMSYSKMELIKWTVLVFCVMHLLACAWALLAQMWGSMRDTAPQEFFDWINECHFGSTCLLPEYQGNCRACVPTFKNGNESRGDADLCDNDCLSECEMALLTTLRNETTDWLGAQEHWLCRYQSRGLVGPGEDHKYFAALYVAILQVGGGVGSIVPENMPEYIFVTFMLLCGSTFWALIVGSICGIVATGDPHATEFKQKMDELNYFMTDMLIEPTLRVRAREYFRQTRDLRKKLSYSELIERLSPTLRGEVVLQMSKKTLETVWYLRACESAFLVELAVCMTREGFAPREKIPSEKLNIVMRGVAAKAGNILTYGDHWGEDMIVSSRALRDLRHASALTYVEVGTISREDLEGVLEQFPNSEREIRQSAMKIAMQRAIVVISEFVRMQQQQKAGSGLSKLAGVFSGGNSFEEGDGDGQTDPSMILNIITGGKLKDIDEEGNIVEEEDDDGAAAARQSQMQAEETMGSLLKELREQRAEVNAQLEAMRKEIAELKAK